MALGTIMNAMSLDNKDVNSAISPYFWFNILCYKKVCFFFFIVCLLLHPFFEKKMDNAHAPNVGFYYALFRCVIDTKRHLSVYYMSKLCIIRNKICVWATLRCVGWWPDTSRSGNWAVIKKEADNTFVLSPMRTHCWFKGPPPDWNISRPLGGHDFLCITFSFTGGKEKKKISILLPKKRNLCVETFWRGWKYVFYEKNSLEEGVVCFESGCFFM